MSSDIYTGFESDNLVGFSYIPSFDHHYPYDDFHLWAVSAGGSPPEDLSLPQLYDPPPQFQEPLVFSSEGTMQRSYSSSCMGTGGGGCWSEGLIRRVYCTGDLQRGGERYSAEERKERIRKYREKRNLRNFSKTIKYACRKTLADSRPRIHGRFARNDDVVGDGELPIITPSLFDAPPPRPPPRCLLLLFMAVGSHDQRAQLWMCQGRRCISH